MAKKIFALALGALLIVAFAAPVMAETKVDFSGQYRVRAHYYNNLVMANDSDDESKSAYLDQRFRAYFKIMPNENVTMNVAIQALDNKWGEGTYSKRYPLDTAGTTSSIEVYYANMEFKTPIGLFSLGRMSAGVAGLTALGWEASGFNPSDVFDTERPEQRIKYILPAGPLTLIAVYEKQIEGDRRNVGFSQVNTVPPFPGYDQDADNYYLMPQYKWANGGANLLLGFRRNASSPIATQKAFLANPSAMVNFGPFGLHGEMMWINGTVEYDPVLTGGLGDDDIEGLGFYADATYNYGPGIVGLQYMYLQGDDNLADSTIKGAATAGGDFNPLYLVTNFGLADVSLDGYSTGLANGNNYWMLAAWMDHSLTEDLLLHAAVGYFGINETGKKYVNGAVTTDDADSSYGTEINLGMNYKLMDNLSWELQLAYFIAGDYIKDKAGRDVGNAYGMRNVLLLKF